MPEFTIEYQTGSQYCSEEVTARTMQAALEIGQKKVQRNDLPDNWDSYDNGGDGLQFIRVCPANREQALIDPEFPELLYCMPSHAPAYYAPDLLKALEALLPLAQKERDRLTRKINEFSGDEDISASAACAKAAALIAKARGAA